MTYEQRQKEWIEKHGLKVGREYKTWDDGTRSKHRPYAGHLDGRHWFRTGPESLATYAHIREIPVKEERVGKWCVFNDADNCDFSEGGIVGILRKVEPNKSYPYTSNPAGCWRNCMLLSDFVKMVEDGD